MFQPGKTLYLTTHKSLADLRQQAGKTETLPQIKSKKELTEEQIRAEQRKEGILLQLSKKDMWELKEKATNTEIKLQYTVCKLEEQLEEMNSKQEAMRKENCDIAETNKTKYGQVSYVSSNHICRNYWI